jgi:hypothetical protein
MPLFVKVRSFLRNLLVNDRVDLDLDQEVHSHLAMLVEENIRAGMSPREAQRAARIELGGIEQVKEQVREQRIGNWLHSVLSDCRFALRQLRKSPAFTVVAVLTLALGIGSATAIFSVMDGALLHPYPYKNAERLATLVVFSGEQFRAWRFPAAAFVDFKQQNHTFDAMFGLVYRKVHYTRSHVIGTQEFTGGSVTPDTFEALGIRPLLGRRKNPRKIVQEKWPVHVPELDLAINPLVEGEPIRINVGHGRLEVPSCFTFHVPRMRSRCMCR